MPKSYSELLKQIEALQKEAEEIRRKEISEVVASIKEAIAQYQLTADDLFGSGGRKTRLRAAATRGASGKAAGGAARYADASGNVWGGRGPRPKWLRDALAGGKQLSDFDVKRAAAGNGRGNTRKSGTPGKRGGTAKYRDDAGNAWSGFGPKPGWLKKALASGRTLEDLAA